jgi:hypothetical protein
VHVAVLDFVFRDRRWTLIVVPVLLLGGIWSPLTRIPAMLRRDNAYQRHVIRLAHAMLDEGNTYLAGDDLVYDREQSHPALRRLSAVYIRAIGEWPKARMDALIAEVDAARPKLVISDYRMTGLPGPFRSYLATRFDPLWSSVDGYAPLVGPEEHRFEVWFDGEYRVEPTDGDAVIDGKPAA